MKELKNNYGLYLLLFIAYCLLPWINDRWVHDKSFFFLNFVVFNPVVCFVGGIVYGGKNGFRLYFPLASVLFSLSSLFFHQLLSIKDGLVWACMYGGLALFGLFVGLGFKFLMSKERLKKNLSLYASIYAIYLSLVVLIYFSFVSSEKIELFILLFICFVFSLLHHIIYTFKNGFNLKIFVLSSTLFFLPIFSFLAYLEYSLWFILTYILTNIVGFYIGKWIKNKL